MYRNYLEGMTSFVTEYGKDKRIAIDQAYGYTMGVTACNERYYDELTEIWEAWRHEMIWNVVQGTEEAAAPEEIEAEETETQEETEAAEEAQQKGQKTMKVIVMTDKVRGLCIKENYYTRGNNDEYSNMFDLCRAAETVEDVKAIAKDIAAHSNIERIMNAYGVTEAEALRYITENILNECSYISLEDETTEEATQEEAEEAAETIEEAAQETEEEEAEEAAEETEEENDEAAQETTEAPAAAPEWMEAKRPEIIRIYGKVLNEWKNYSEKWHCDIAYQREYAYKDIDATTGEIVATGSEDFSAEREAREIEYKWIYTWNGQKRNKGGYRWFDCQGTIKYRKSGKKAVKQYLKMKYNAEEAQLRY